MTKRKKQTGRYVVEINDWGCGVLIKDTITGKEIDAPAEETVNLCLVEMNRLAAELADLKSEAGRFKAEVERMTIERNGFEQAMKANQSILETKRDEIERLRKAGDWQPIETATWDNLSKDDRVILNGWNGNVRFAYVVDFNGCVDFEDEYGVPMMRQYDGYTHWMHIPNHPAAKDGKPSE